MFNEDGQQTYHSYKDLPPLAGVSSFAAAEQPGISVDECVRRLKRYYYAFKRLHQIFIARITAEPIYELKMAFSLHAYLAAEQIDPLSKRVGEMREPPLGLEIVPDAALELFFDEILAAPTTEALVAGLYEKAAPALYRALNRHINDTNPVADQPSIRLCRHALLDLDDIITFGTQTVDRLIDAQQREQLADWLVLLDRALERSGDLDGTQQSEQAASEAEPLTRRYSATPYVYDGIPKRDERFPDPYNMGVNAEAFLYNERYPLDAKVLMMFYKRIREIDVPEMMASILMETPDKPWDYYLDMTRQLWDEARHALMGEIGFVSLGVDWHKVMINFTYSLALNSKLQPLQRHGVLYFIEQGLMPRNGKRYEWEVASASGNPLSRLFQDYDWADEVLHAHIGRRWYVSEFPNREQANKFGDDAWSTTLQDWTIWKEQGLTQHRNWWPDLYLDACRQAGHEPDPDVLAYHETYEATRADLQQIDG